MMQILAEEIEPFLHWTNNRCGKTLSVAGDFPMSSKVYVNYDGPKGGMLAAFTTIVPGAGKGKDPYWTIVDACQHLVEVSYLFKWIHRRPGVVQPEMHVIFDGSSNHTARALDGLHCGAGVCKGPGGANAPGAPLKDKGAKPDAYGMKMRDGCFIDKSGKLVVQQMHRDKTWMDDKSDNKKAIFNESDGSIFKGVEEILREMGDNFEAIDKARMPYRCNKARRRKLRFGDDNMCTPGVRCCMHNTLRCRQDFCEQKCKLEEVCETVGAKFHLLPICHPELNPIEGKKNKHSHHNYFHEMSSSILLYACRLLELYQKVGS
jgi:hypothetical protein